MPRDVVLKQEDIEVAGHRFTVTHIPTAASGSWFTVHEVCEVWAAVAMDITGKVIGWRNPPEERYRAEQEEAIKNAFGIP